MSSFIRIVNGSYRKADVSDKVFELVEQYKDGAKGGFVTVMNGGQFPGCPDKVRISVNSPMDYVFVTDGEQVSQVVEAAQVAEESDEEVIVRIRERFEILHEMTKAAAN